MNMFCAGLNFVLAINSKPTSINVINPFTPPSLPKCTYRGADKSLAQTGRKHARKHVRTRAISTLSRSELSSNFFSYKTWTPKEIFAILTETLACFLPGRAKDLSASLYQGLPSRFLRHNFYEILTCIFHSSHHHVVQSC